MPLLADRIQETSTTTGTGTLTLAGAVSGYRTFNAAFANGNVVFYTIDDTLGNWEVGYGTVGSGTLTRDAVLESSNADNEVSFGSGVKRVFCSAPTRALLPNQTSNSGKFLTSDGISPSWATISQMSYPSAGIAVSTGSAWGSSLSAPSGALVGTTDSQILTNKTISGSDNTLSNIGNSSLTNSSITINGSAISLGGTATVTASTTNALTIGTGLSGTSFNGSSAVTIAIDSTVATLSGSQILTNKTISGGNNTLSNIANASLTNSSITLGSTTIALGATQASLTTLTNLGYSGTLTGGTGVINIGSGQLYKDASGNVGIGAAANAGWSSRGRALQIDNGSFNGSFAALDSGLIQLCNNVYAASLTDNYAATGAASRYYQYLGTHVWESAVSGSANGAITWLERLRIDSSGNVGIGTSSPATKLTVTGDASSVQLYHNVCSIQFASSPNRTNSWYIGANISDAINGGFFIGSGANINSGTPRLIVDSSNLLLRQSSNAANTSVSFDTTIQNALTLDSSGVLSTYDGIEVSANNSGDRNSYIDFHSDDTYTDYSLRIIAASGANGRRIFEARGTGGINIVVVEAGPILFSTSNAERLRIDSSGNLISTAVYAATVGATNRDLYIDNTGKFGYVSSLRASKVNIEDLTDTSWLSQLNPVSFNYRKKAEDGSYTDEIDGDIQYGMIAEDVEMVRPDLCFYDETENGLELRGIQYSKLVPVMLKAIQELHAEIEQLKQRIN